MSAAWRAKYLSVDVYPLIAVMGLAGGTVGYFGYSKVARDPQLAVQKAVRLAGHDAMYARPSADHHKTGLAYASLNWNPRIFGDGTNPILETKRTPSDLSSMPEVIIMGGEEPEVVEEVVEAVTEAEVVPEVVAAVAEGSAVVAEAVAETVSAVASEGDGQSE
eukprot:CAMPEP_0198328476 /NCGR_PEP_ID=MMETSP1450-20131203/15513_1 /TAXON_ID=753684 ORGANISM="Madagascaria erythrocladiodes, Strain CCMP3234" /NCGR_SAMPLE_ID=MMETSP1450 /ASSEMBLY_ACC=CAM_ASM_001115 /LENGTH=162 /DNA_ID=CAMNT_0044032615 /DNA_START=91 /DNA_END=579 /DNA_ORIENTATION=-